MTPTDLARHLTAYLGSDLPGQRNFSTNTIKSYRDAFSLLLTYCHDERGLAIERITLETLSDTFIEGFLSWLEDDRGNSITTRNQRLAAIHAFFRYLQQEEPALLLSCQRILAIPFKRQARTPVCHLPADDVHTLLSQPDQRTIFGRRDLAMLCVLYDTGARVQELVDLLVRDVRLDPPAVVRLTGKGRKTRCVPLMTRTTLVLESYLEEWRLTTPGKLDRPLFFNRQHRKLTRAGVSYVLHKYAEQSAACSSGFSHPVTPHVLRHSKAMHLLQAGVNLIYIRDILGHVDIKTTEIYARADTEMKRHALEQLQAPPGPTDRPSWDKDENLLSWLRSL